MVKKGNKDCHPGIEGTPFSSKICILRRGFFTFGHHKQQFECTRVRKACSSFAREQRGYGLEH
jgi:hypothetical protein